MTHECFLWTIGYLTKRRPKQLPFSLNRCQCQRALRLGCNLIAINFGSDTIMEKMTFSVKYGHYEYVVMSFWSTNVPIFYGGHG